MPSTSRHAWTSKSLHAPQLSPLEIVKVWCMACGPLSFIAYFFAISLGLFVAQKHDNHSLYSTYLIALCAFFCMHAAINMLCNLFDYLEGRDSIDKVSILQKGLISPRAMSLSILALGALSLMSAAWLVIHSTHAWPCFLLFLSIFSAMIYGTPSRRYGGLSFGNVFLTLNVALAMLALTYAVMSDDFSSYTLTLMVPVGLFIAAIVHYQGVSTEDKKHIACKHIALAFFTAQQVSQFFRFVTFLSWAVMLNLILHGVPLKNVEFIPVEKSILAQYSSTTIEAYTQDAIERGVSYGFGAKDSHTGAIDCSGWITEINLKMMRSINATLGKEVYGQKAKLTLTIGANGGAAGLILAIKVVTEELLLNEDLSPDKVREGLTIGLDTGVKDWDIGRFAGIDHIVQTYKDQESGQIMVSQSSGGIGVHSMPYDEWYTTWNEKAKLYGVDISLLADPIPVL